MSDASSKESEHQTLLAAARAGEESSLWRLCDRLRPRLKGIVARYLGRRLSAKVGESDVLQNAMQAAYRAFPEFNGETEEEFQAWLIRIVKNEIHDARRFWNQARRDVKLEQVKLDEPGGPGLDPSGDSGVSGQAMRNEQAKRLLALLDRLPHDERQVVRLRHLENRSLAEISETMQRSLDGTAGLLKRAMRRLKEMRSEIDSNDT